MALVAVGRPELEQLIRAAGGVTVQALDGAVQSGKADVVEAGNGEAAVLLGIHKFLLLPPHENVRVLRKLAAPADTQRKLSTLIARKGP